MKKFLVFLVALIISVEGFSIIKIGAVFSMTGSIAAFGQMIWQGVELGNEVFPDANGEKIEIILLDNHSDKVEAVNTVRRLIEQEKVCAIIGEGASSNTIVGGAVAEELKVPMLSPSSTNPLANIGKKYVSKVCFSDPFQGIAAANLAFDDMKTSNVAVFMDIEQDYAVGFANFFKETANEFGGSMFYEYYKSGDQDFTAQISDAIARGADAFFIPGYYQEIALIALQARQLGFYEPIIAGDGAAVPETIEIGGESVDELYFTTHYHPDSPAITDNAKIFIDKYTEKYGKAPGNFAALGFDAYLVMRDALIRAGNITPEDIAKMIRSTTDFPAVTGLISINDNGDAIKSVSVVKIENGEFKYSTTINP